MFATGDGSGGGGRPSDLSAIAGRLLVIGGPVAIVAGFVVRGLAGNALVTLGLGLLAAGLVAVAAAWGRRWRRDPALQPAVEPWVEPALEPGVEPAVVEPSLGVGPQPQVASVREPFRGPSPFLVLPAVVAATSFFEFLVLFTGIPLDDAAASLVSVLLLAGSSIGIIWFVVVRPGWLSWAEMGVRLPAGNRRLIDDLTAGAALAFPAVIAAGLIGQALISLLGVTPESPVTPTQDPASFLVLLAAATVVAPAWEETFFRGYATTAWERSRGLRWALIVGAIFFAGIHAPELLGSDPGTALQKAFLAFAIRLPAGLLLGWLFLRRRSLAAPIALHVAYNAIPLLLSFALGPGTPGS